MYSATEIWQWHITVPNDPEPVRGSPVLMSRQCVTSKSLRSSIIRVVFGSVQYEAHGARIQRRVHGSKRHLRLATGVAVARWSHAPSYVAVHASSAPVPANSNTIIRPLRMHCIDAVYCYRCHTWSVWLFGARTSPAKTAELIKIPFGELTLVGTTREPTRGRHNFVFRPIEKHWASLLQCTIKAQHVMCSLSSLFFDCLFTVLGRFWQPQPCTHAPV